MNYDYVQFKEWLLFCFQNVLKKKQEACFMTEFAMLIIIWFHDKWKEKLFSILFDSVESFP